MNYSKHKTKWQVPFCFVTAQTCVTVLSSSRLLPKDLIPAGFFTTFRMTFLWTKSDLLLCFVSCYIAPEKQNVVFDTLNQWYWLVCPPKRRRYWKTISKQLHSSSFAWNLKQSFFVANSWMQVILQMYWVVVNALFKDGLKISPKEEWEVFLQVTKIMKTLLN